MKDGLGKSAIYRIAKSIYLSYKPFKKQEFVKEALSGIDNLEMKERVSFLIELLHDFLPKDFTKVTKIFLKAKKNWDYGDLNNPIRGFAAWPIIDYIAKYGIDYPEALDLLEKLTPLFTAEFAIRPFITKHFDITYSKMLEWTKDEDEHVRRLASEGIRPRLPWGEQLPQFMKNPKPIFAILEELKNDESEYVRKSVANNLNDISKDNPDLLIKLCKRWSKAKSKNQDWIIKRALRTLIKQGRKEVFPLLGFTTSPRVEIYNVKLDKTLIKIGEEILLSFEIKNNQKNNFVLDYAIEYAKANNKTSKKVFKLKEITAKKDEIVNVNKSISFKKITTRKFYAGKHNIEILVNGVLKHEVGFELKEV